jgi:hypothetical protein
MPPRRRPGRKLLVASIGVATLNYAAVSCGSPDGTRTVTLHDASDEAAGDAQGDAIEAAADAMSETSTDAGAADAGKGDASADAVDDYPVANLAVP